MNHSVGQDEISETIVRAIIIWEVRPSWVLVAPCNTYSFVISISRTYVKPNVRGGGFLPLTAQYLGPNTYLRPTYDLLVLSPDFEVLQAICTKLNDLPIRTDIADIEGHQDRTKSCATNLTPSCKS
jgi:hypothetical protein